MYGNGKQNILQSICITYWVGGTNYGVGEEVLTIALQRQIDEKK